MWNNADYDALPRLGEEYTLAEFKTLCGTETVIDEATETALYWFFINRKITTTDTITLKGSTDVTKLWEVYFKRHIDMYAKQYLDYLRIQTTEIDPLVTQYMERLLNTVQRNAQTRNATAADVATGNATTNTQNSDSRTSNQSGKADRTTRDNREGTENATDAGTRNVESTIHDNGSGTREGSTNTDQTTNATDTHKDMNAELPQSATGAGMGLPTELNWAYATRQNESKDGHDSTGNTDETRNESYSDEKTQTRNDGETTNATRETNRNEAGTGEAHDTNTLQGSEQGTATGQVNTTNTGRTDHTAQETASGNESGQTTERYSGRQGSPQELLDAARQYVTKTNAWKWFVAQLDDCFMNWYEV